MSTDQKDPSTDPVIIQHALKNYSRSEYPNQIIALTMLEGFLASFLFPERYEHWAIANGWQVTPEYQHIKNDQRQIAQDFNIRGATRVALPEDARDNPPPQVQELLASTVILEGAQKLDIQNSFASAGANPAMQVASTSPTMTLNAGTAPTFG